MSETKARQSEPAARCGGGINRLLLFRQCHNSCRPYNNHHPRSGKPQFSGQSCPHLHPIRGHGGGLCVNAASFRCLPNSWSAGHNDTNKGWGYAKEKSQSAGESSSGKARQAGCDSLFADCRCGHRFRYRRRGRKKKTPLRRSNEFSILSWGDPVMARKKVADRTG